MARCPVCNININRDQKNIVQCTSCNLIFHGECCNFNERDIEALKSLKKDWCCGSCEVARRALPRDERPATPVKLSTPDPFKEVLDQLKALASEVASIGAAVSEIKLVKESLDKFGELAKENAKRLTNLESGLDNQGKLLEATLLENQTLKSRITELEVCVNRAEQGLLSTSVEIRGIPVSAGESPAGLVTTIGASLGLKLSPEDLDTVERRRARRDDLRPPAIVAKFVRQSVRDDYVRKAKVKRDLTTRDLGSTDNECHRIFVSEDMSPINRRLYYLARRKRAEGKAKYVWFGGGRVRCRQDDGRPVVIINTPDDLNVFS